VGIIETTWGETHGRPRRTCVRERHEIRVEPELVEVITQYNLDRATAKVDDNVARQSSKRSGGSFLLLCDGIGRRNSAKGRVHMVDQNQKGRAAVLTNLAVGVHAARG